MRCGERSNACGGQDLVFGPPKSDQIASEYPATGVLARGAAVNRERQEVERLTAGDSRQDSGLIFQRLWARLRSGEICPDFRAFGAAVRRAFDPVPRPTAHMCVAASGPGCLAPWVMDVLGHSQLSITMDLYSPVCRMPYATPQTRWIGALNGGR